MGAKTSLFEFRGALSPADILPPIRATYSLNRPDGSVSIDVEGHSVTVRFIVQYESFDDLFRQTYEYVLGFFAVGTIRTGVAVDFRFDEWIETPLGGANAEGVAHRVKGQVLHSDPDAPPPLILPEDYTFGLAHGMQWSEDLATNPFLRRAVLDFNHSLKHPLNDIPIYLARAIESIENYFGGEEALIHSLSVAAEVKQVKRQANDALGGLHTRHAARTEAMTPLSRDQIIESVDAVRNVLLKFQMHLMTRRMKDQSGQGHEQKLPNNSMEPTWPARE
jgi:hypothetical protein